MSRTGRPSTSGPASEKFLQSSFDPRTGRLTVPTYGRIWEAIRAAHASGSRGGGRCIAIADMEFDPDFLPTDRVHRESSYPPYEPGPTRARHGTVVALLALAAAPEAQVLLIDVHEGDGLSVPKMAAAIARAADLGADAVNISGEFTTDCTPRQMPPLEGDSLLTVDPDPDMFDRFVQMWIDHSEPYADARCRWSCRICDSIAENAGSTLVVAAAGNVYETACPACVASVVGVGFQRSLTVEVDGRVLLGHGLAQTEHGNLLRPELTIDEPPGFLGTSFASPLLAGLAVLVPNPGDIAEMARLPWAVTPILHLANLLGQADPATISPRSISTFLAATRRFSDAIPAAHQHWNQGPDGQVACAVCSLLLTDWYDTTVAIYLMIADEQTLPRALRWATFAAALAPFSASTASNAAVAWERSADHVQGADRRTALVQAKQHIAHAVELARAESEAVGQTHNVPDIYAANDARITRKLDETLR